MTTWCPDLSAGTGPLYVRLADLIERDIDSGRLTAGAKLPPQRNLAFDLGVTIGTVSRAYALAHERGLVSGEVGRGTYVRQRRTPDFPAAAASAPEMPAIAPGHAGPQPALRLDSTAAPEIGVAPVLERISAEICREAPDGVTSYIRTIPTAWLEAGARWLGRDGWHPDPASIVPSQGAHAAIMSVIAATTMPGDRIAFEPLTYASIARSAALSGRRASLVAADAEGVVPDDLERVCAQQHPKVLFLMPAPQNPTLAMMGEERRRAIAEIARRHQLWIIEDAVYGVLLQDGVPPIASIAPERVFHVGSLSKAVAAGLRGGWVACPPNFAGRVTMAHKMITGGKPFLMSELVARLVNSGLAFELAAATRADIARRVALARETFAGLDVRLHDAAPFLWLTLPEPWLSGTFKNAAAAEGILIDEEDEYKPARSDIAYHGVRVGFSTVPAFDHLATGFRILRRLVDQGPSAYDSYN
ncbi:PLP-dependent aminotransferase family protein [Propylenella binzhouense]|uniref:PLP-dependent aminotransferase family protein n=1 Tax=Propylenella binzhouense TaxID=2555902 RepID=A0A964T3Z8_9HYPH|nr:PLP-dependent aminotransferase family protein [Propylenella binzhouense]MYZ48071.1 PLP-dependent aminotransferase family protein [Propylenella binzhouense]